MMTPIQAEIPEALAQAIAAYIRDQPTQTSIPAVIQTALEVFLTEHGYLPREPKRLRITPSEGSGYTNTAISIAETALLCEPALAEDWNRPEEDKAWSHLQKTVEANH